MKQQIRFSLLLALVLTVLGCGSSGGETPIVDNGGTDGGTGGTDGSEDGTANGTGYTQVNTDTNKLGAWIFYIDQGGLVRNNHKDMAEYLAGIGIKRVFIKISDINYNWADNKITFDGDTVNCGVWQDACEPVNLQHYKDNGIEPWAWTYNDIGLYDDQADMLEAAIKVGYDGFVLDIETEFDNRPIDLEELVKTYRDRLTALSDEAPAHFKLAATTWGNPKDHNMDVGIIDKYVDMHMPQTYVEKWGGSALENIALTIDLGDCEYRSLGAEKPIWHIVSHEDKILSADDLNTFVEYAGPNASMWRVADADQMIEIEAMDWHATSFQSGECTENNFELE